MTYNYMKIILVQLDLYKCTHVLLRSAICLVRIMTCFMVWLYRYQNEMVSGSKRPAMCFRGLCQPLAVIIMAWTEDTQTCFIFLHLTFIQQSILSQCKGFPFKLICCHFVIGSKSFRCGILVILLSVSLRTAGLFIACINATGIDAKLVLLAYTPLRFGNQSCRGGNTQKGFPEI